MRVVVIGGSGHIGTFLIPRLVRAGHDVVNVSRDSAPATPTTRRGGTSARRPPTGTPATSRTRSSICGPTSSSTSSASRSTRPPRWSSGSGHLLHCGSIWRAHRSRHEIEVRDERMEAPASADDQSPTPPDLR